MICFQYESSTGVFNTMAHVKRFFHEKKLERDKLKHPVIDNYVILTKIEPK